MAQQGPLQQRFVPAAATPAATRQNPLCAALRGLRVGLQLPHVPAFGNHALLFNPVADFLRFGLKPLKVGGVEVVLGSHVAGDVVGQEVGTKFLDAADPERDVRECPAKVVRGDVVRGV